MRTPLTHVLLTLTTALALSACSGEGTAADEAPTTSPSASSSSPTESASTEPEPEPEGTVVEITVKGDTVDPNGESVEVPLGEPVTLDVTADRPGELHVHSTPAQEVAFQRGHTTIELTIDKPGVVEVEDHESGKVIVQLQVS